MIKIREDFNALGGSTHLPLVATGQADPLGEESVNIPGMGSIRVSGQGGGIPDPGLLIPRRVPFQEEAFRPSKLEFQGLERQAVSLDRLHASKDDKYRGDLLDHDKGNLFRRNF